MCAKKNPIKGSSKLLSGRAARERHFEVMFKILCMNCDTQSAKELLDDGLVTKEVVERLFYEPAGGWRKNAVGLFLFQTNIVRLAMLAGWAS